MAASPTDILNAGFALVDLSKSRDTAIREYERFKTQMSDEFYNLGDSDYFSSVHGAYIKRKDLIEKTFTESKKLFDMLPEPLQFGLKELSKPVVLPDNRGFNTKAARCLVVKLKPVDPKIPASERPKEPEYSYDVQVIDVSPKN